MTSWSTATVRWQMSVRHFAASSRFAPTAIGMAWTAGSPHRSSASSCSARRCDSTTVARHERARIAAPSPGELVQRAEEPLDDVPTAREVALHLLVELRPRALLELAQRVADVAG